MGKCRVVADFGIGKTKISIYFATKDGMEFREGAVFNTPEGILENPETLQAFILHLDKLSVKGGDLYVVLPVDENLVFCQNKEYPVGTKKEMKAFMKNSLSDIVKENPEQYFTAGKLLETYSSGQGLFQVIAVKAEPIKALCEAAEKKHLKVKRIDIAQNALADIACLMRNDDKRGLRTNDDAIAVVDVGYKTVQVVVLTKDRVLSTDYFEHELYRLDKIIMNNAYDLKNDPKIVPELLKLNPSYTSKISQYNSFLDMLTSDTVRKIKHGVSAESRYHLTTIYFTGGMYRAPTLVSKIKESFNVPCFAFPMDEILPIGGSIIITGQNSPKPTSDLFAPSIGIMKGGN